MASQTYVKTVVGMTLFWLMGAQVLITVMGGVSVAVNSGMETVLYFWS